MKVLKNIHLCVHGVLFIAGPHNVKRISKPLFQLLCTRLIVFFLESGLGGAKGHGNPQISMPIVNTSTQ